jgi:tRNA (guanosine-2'-O-)-methyltransferase
LPLIRLSRLPEPAADPSLTPDVVVQALAPFLSLARKRRIEDVLRRRLGSVTVVMENLYDPHNGAAVLRTCEAFGLLHVHVVEGAEPFYFSRKVSQSAHKWLCVYLHPSISSCINTLRSAGFSCFAALPPPRGGGPECPVPPCPQGDAGPPVGRPVALVFGNEHAGLSGEALALCDGRFSIPLQGFTESLNLSVSAAVALHAAVQRRRKLLDGKPELEGELLARLRAAYYALSTSHAVPLILDHLRRTRREESI